MPRTSDKIAIKNEFLDRRVKLTKDDKALICELYKEGMAIREIARFFPQVCRRTIQFVLFPERAEKVNYSGHWAKYYDKQGHKMAMRKHRAYKNELFKQGKIK